VPEYSETRVGSVGGKHSDLKDGFVIFYFIIIGILN
jgi:hypothetical protein